MTRRLADTDDGINEAAWERAMTPRRRRRTTPVTKPMAPVTMEQIAREFAEAMNQDTKEGTET